MPTTRKKVIKTVYKDEDDSEDEKLAGDFSDSGSDAQITEQSSSEEDEGLSEHSSGDEFANKSKKPPTKRKTLARPTQKKFTKEFLSKTHKQQTSASLNSDNEDTEETPAPFSVKDLTEADKLLPSVLNLSESDSSDDESSKQPAKKQSATSTTLTAKCKDSDSETETNMEYRDVWSNNLQDNSEDIAKKTFMELEEHKSKIAETKATLLSYASLNKQSSARVSNVKDLLAQGEEISPQATPSKKSQKTKNVQDDSDSEMEWEEVKDAKGIPQQGLQLIVAIPDSVCRKSKKLDVEMMMKRKINRVKKEHQVYMHKVHVLCWIGHGNHVSSVLNDQEILAAALSLVPSKECYPGERVDMKYVEQITTWYKDKFTFKQDKNEDKFRPKAPHLKEILKTQIKSRVVKAKKYLVFIFVSMLRALGLQCRVMFNFVTVPLKPPSSELCSLSTKPKSDDAKDKQKNKGSTPKNSETAKKTYKNKSKQKIAQVDGNYDVIMLSNSENEFEDIMQLDGNNDNMVVKTRSARNTRANKANMKDGCDETDGVSPPKKSRKSLSVTKVSNCEKEIVTNSTEVSSKRKTAVKSKKESDDIDSTDKQKQLLLTTSRPRRKVSDDKIENNDVKSKKESDDIDSTDKQKQLLPTTSRRRRKVSDDKIENNYDARKTNALENSLQNTNTRNEKKAKNALKAAESKSQVESGDTDTKDKINKPPTIVVTKEEDLNTSKYFAEDRNQTKTKRLSLSRKRSQTTNTPSKSSETVADEKQTKQTKSRAKSVPGPAVEKSKYFEDKNIGKTSEEKKPTRRISRAVKKEEEDDNKRVSHRDLLANKKSKTTDVTADLVDIIKSRVKEAKAETKKRIVKDKMKNETDEDSDYLPEEEPKRRNSESDDDFKPAKISPRPSTSRKRIDRRVISTDDEAPNNKIDMWCEIFVEELEQWIAVDVVRAKVHCTNEIYARATHPVCYVVGWDNNNYLKDLTRRYVPHWNTVTRKQRVEAAWWDAAVAPWRGPRTARDREEDDQLNRLQLEAPLPKSIAEYKNHPLYALKRHLLKFEALYPPDAATLGFVRGEAVYARECVYVCRSRDTWLKEAKVVRLGEQPYKVVKARPKWDKLSNKLITDKPLEVFGPWQVQDYEPPVAENGVVPRNAYGNVELFKDCMLPKGTVHIKLPGLNKVAKKLNIDCAPAMTGFDFNGGWSHPVYDGFVVCQEFEEIVTEAWLNDQEEQERKELEKIEARVYGNWRRLIKGLLIRERLKLKYGFEEPSTSQDKKKAKAPRLVVKKK